MPRLPDPHPADPLPRPARVDALRQLDGGIVALTLKLDGEPRLRFEAGQSLRLRIGAHPPQLLAIASAPRPAGVDRLELHLRPDQLPSTLPLQAGATIEAPLGGFHWQAGVDRPAVLLVQGGEFAPALAIVEHTLLTHWQRPLHLYWGVERPELLYLHAQAQAWADAHDHLYYTPVLQASRAPLNWPGRIGLAADALAEDIPALADYQLYLCGEALLPARERLIAWSGADPRHLHLREPASFVMATSFIA